MVHPGPQVLMSSLPFEVQETIANARAPATKTLKRVRDLQALSISEMCMDFVPGLVKVTLQPRSGCVPKVLSTLFHSQVVKRLSLHPPPFASGEDELLHMLCPVRALKIYVDHSSCSSCCRQGTFLAEKSEEQMAQSPI